MRVGDLALWKGVGKVLIVVIVKVIEELPHYHCQVIEDGSTFVITEQDLEAV
jgi:hypothetical protein